MCLAHNRNRDRNKISFNQVIKIEIIYFHFYFYSKIQLWRTKRVLGINHMEAYSDFQYYEHIGSYMQIILLSN